MIAPFGTLPDGRAVQAVTLTSGRLVARVLTLGAIVQDLRLSGVAHPLVLGSPDPTRYAAEMGTEFLSQIGELASAALSRLLPRG